MPIKTPLGHKLQTELANEFTRMDSEWFFRWHALGYGGTVDVDRFDGQRIHIGGVRFAGSAELVYWDAVARYVRNKINDIFERTESEIRVSDRASAADLASDAADALLTFCQRILHHAIDTDRLLKGQGHPDRSYVSPNTSRVSFADEIQQRRNALAQFYQTNPTPTSWGHQFERLVERNKGKLQVFGALAAACSILGILGRVFGLF